jgi:5-methylcytosine-specific restriction endonuclease McrA
MPTSPGTTMVAEAGKQVKSQVQKCRRAPGRAAGVAPEWSFGMHDQSTRACARCGRSNQARYIAGLCKTCYEHQRLRQEDRPLRQSPGERACSHCGRVGVEAFERCVDCYSYWRRHGSDRPDLLLDRAAVKLFGQRVCRYCNRTLSPDAFHRNKRDGLQSRCRECHATRMASIRETRSLAAAQVRECAECGAEFRTTSPQKITCSSSCRRVRHSRALQEWSRLNPVLRSRSREKRKALERGASVSVRIDRLAIFERDEWLCQLCGKPVDRALRHPHPWSASIDHRVPLSKGGEHVPANVQLAHFGCNSGKRDRVA